MKLKYFLGIFAFAFGATMLTSCDDDDYDVVGNPDNLVYVNIAQDYPDNMPKNTYTYTLYQTPVGPLVASEPETIELYVYDTKKAGKDITATLELAPDMEIPGYAKFPENSGIVVTLADNKVTIPAGSNRSNAVAVNVDVTNANWSLFTESAYLLPVKVTSSSDGGKVSEDLNMAYIGINVDKKEGMVNPDANTNTGTSITDKSNWSGTYSVPATGATGNLSRACFDGNNNNYGYLVFNHADGVNEEVITTIDLGEVRNLSGVHFQYFGWYFYIKDGSLETSTDGVTWEAQGSREWPNQYSGRTAHFVFWAPFPVRYFRLTSHSYHGGTGEGQVLAEVYAYE